MSARCQPCQGAHKGTLFKTLRMSACGYKHTSSRPKSTSALPPKADILVVITDSRL